MKKIVKFLFLTGMSLILIYIVFARVSLWFEDRRLQAERLEKLIELTQVSAFRYMTVLYYKGSNSRAVRETSGSRFVFFSAAPLSYISATTLTSKIDAKEDVAPLRRDMLSEMVGRDIGELRGSIFYFRLRPQNHQLHISVIETKDGFYIEVDDIWTTE